MEQLSNRYRLVEMIGQGGMAKVYRAEDEVLGRTVAVKVLREQYASDQAFLGRFLNEARSAASLSHPNIVSVFDVGDEGGRYYIVMEYVAGSSLKEVIQQQAPFSVERAVSIAGQICSGLQAAHSRNLVHRDIKPQNVLVTGEGQVKIADFGIARALGEASFSETGQVFGSIHYLSPEQAQGKQATPASDIYSLGVVCYEMLSARLPFQGETVVGVALQHIQEPPRPLHELNPTIPPLLESIVLRALAKSPEQRYQSAKEMGQSLQDYSQLGEQATSLIRPVSTRPSGLVSSDTSPVHPVSMATPPAQERPRSGGGNFLLLALAILALISILGLFALFSVVYQSYSDRFAFKLPTISLPTATASAVPLVKVPTLQGLAAAEALSLIDSYKLVYKEGPPENSDTIPAGHVIRQSIAPGTEVKPGLEVMVALSKGRASVEVPAVVGVKLAEAQSKIEAAGLVVARQELVNGSVAADTVFDQQPLAGARVAPGSTITVSVAKASNKILVPDVVGKKEEDAKKIITDAGLRLFPWVNPQGHGDLPGWLVESVPVGSVLSTTPKAGTEVELGTQIQLAIRKD